MENRDDQDQANPTSDISKSQSPQQPSGQGDLGSKDPTAQGEGMETRESGQYDQSAQSTPTSEASDTGREQGDTLAQRRTDIEGSSLGSSEKGEAESGFIGTEGSSDSSSELIDKQDFAKDGQGATDSE